ncbi:MAG: Cof-type HAD-IIB family hydrolase [Spirochaetia bacterium]|jgi:Cof subfamily protein (haloacid dehalogenase superfamily)|nr:Cof-type HAD-IIB family hydrolase [Spirochaetia bacterium]
MINSFRLLALDLDGTLTNSEKQITAKTFEVVTKVLQLGVNIVLASGRPVLGINPIAKQLQLYRLGGFILANNGGYVLDCKKRKIVSEQLISQIYYSEICSMARAYNIQPLTYNEKGVLAESLVDPYIQKEAFNNGTIIQKVDCLENSISKEVPKFMIVGNPRLIEKALNPIKKHFSGVLNVFLSEPYFIEIVPLGVEKAHSLHKLLIYLGLRRENLIAIGDGLNDLPMLKYAGFSIAMGNACDTVKENVNAVTRSNDEDGVAFALEKFIL